MFVFLMDKGQLVRLDPDKLSNNVSSLRNLLASELLIPLDKQILLVSGGFQLEPGDKLSAHGAGLDKTNPIYVFTRTTPDDPFYQKPDVLEINDGRYPEKIEALLSSAPSLPGLNERFCAVQSLCPIAHETCEAIEQLISEQRQMIQGWCVALANLAEVAADTNKRLLDASYRLTVFESRYAEWDQKLHLVNEVKRDLFQIPLLPQLIGCSSDQTMQLQSNFTPANLYEWVCLQSFLSAVPGRGFRPPRAGSARHSQPTRLLNLSESSTMGRPRTTSVGEIGQFDLPQYLRKQNHSGSTGTPNSPQERIMRNPSGDSLFALCPGSPSLPHRKALPETGNLSADLEREFLKIVDTAVNDMNFLRFGDTVVVDAAGSNVHELLYARRLASRLDELLSLVTSFSQNNNTSHDTETSILVESTEPDCVSDIGRSGLPGGIDPETVNQTKNSLDRTYFSRLLAALSPMTEEARQVVDLIDQVEHNLARSYQQAYKTQNISVVNEQFGAHTSQLRELLAAFTQLCTIFSQAMQSKMNLSDNLQQRQRWLQNFQSYIHTLDANIQKCLTRIDRIIRTGSLISQLQAAPEVYAKCLVEVVRQNEFEASLLQAAREQRASKIEEAHRRRQFAKQLRVNILHSLFAPWTVTRIDRLAGSTRVLNVADSDPAPPHVTAYKLSEQRYLNKTGVGSRSESHLNELVNSPSFHRSGTRLRPVTKETLRTAVHNKLPEVDENEQDTLAIDGSSRGKHLSGSAVPAHSTGSRTHSLSINTHCRASLPSAFADAMPIPKWSLGDNVSMEDDPCTAPDSMRSSLCITRDDLDRLSIILPPHIAGVLRDELSKTLGHMPASQVRSCRIEAAPDPTLFPDRLKDSGLTSTDAACQTDTMNTLSSSARIWSPYGHSLSLVLPVTGSPQRTMAGWEPMPSSLCSWEFCPGPSTIRLGLKRAASTNALMDFTSTAVKVTQTDSTFPPNVPPSSSPRGSGDELSDQAGLVRSLTELQTSEKVEDPAKNPSDSAKPSGTGILSKLSEGLASLTLDSIPGDELYTENDYSTPHTMMSSSFHSTRTNLSIPEANPVVGSKGEVVRSELDDLDTLGGTPTQSGSTRMLVHRGVASPFLSLSLSSNKGDWPEAHNEPQFPGSCDLLRWHLACVRLADDFSGAFCGGSFQDMVSAAGGPSIPSEQIRALDQLFEQLTRYARSYGHSLCSAQAGLREPTETEESHRFVLCDIEATGNSQGSPPVRKRSMKIQSDQTMCGEDKSTCITPPSESHLDVSSEPDKLPACSSSAFISDVIPLDHPLMLSSVKTVQRFFTFAHSNFVCNDTVVFVPVRGAAQHSSPAKQRLLDEVDKDRSPTQQSASAVASSMLSSTIIQSMNSTSTTPLVPSHRVGRSAMNSSLYPGTSASASRSQSGLLKDLFDSTMNVLFDTTQPYSSHSASSLRVTDTPPPSTVSPPPPPPLNVCPGSETSVTQWRMISSDGRVYFLHQDDFAELNLDPSVDYCQPIVRSLKSNRASTSCSTVDPTSSSSGARSYFIVASYQRKERCLSKRRNNRFNLPKDFAFYRVRVKPLQLRQGIESSLPSP